MGNSLSFVCMCISVYIYFTHTPVCAHTHVSKPIFMHRIIIEKVKVGCSDLRAAVLLHSERATLKIKFAPMSFSSATGDTVIFAFNILLCLGTLR